jgi:hypothetical protein
MLPNLKPPLTQEQSRVARKMWTIALQAVFAQPSSSVDG